MEPRITWPGDGPFLGGGSCTFHLWLAEVMESPSKMAAHRSVGRKLQELDHVLRHGPVGVLRRRRLQLNATRVAAATTPSPRRGGSPYPGARPLGSARLSVQPGLAPRQFPSWRQETSGSSSGDAGQPAVAQVGETTAGGSTVTGLLHQILLTILAGTAGTMAVLLLGTEAAQGDREGQPVQALRLPPPGVWAPSRCAC
jgi:hypothetical protein